ncbi:hypothetical protein R3P38DRAFT_2787775 [Favolaschia claudopus]|uniref:Uncharacterized protein n=1 Tax=Favolaschia claudopus TaxID=2862362 RepID=A0AAW0ANI2_9AGAR
MTCFDGKPPPNQITVKGVGRSKRDGEVAQDTSEQGPHLPFRKWQWWQEGFLRVATHFHLRGRNGTVKPPIHPKNVFVAEVDGFSPIFHYKTDTWQEWHHFLPHKNMVAEVDTFKPKFHYKTVWLPKAPQDTAVAAPPWQVSNNKMDGLIRLANPTFHNAQCHPNAQALHQKITELHLDQTTHRHGGWARLATVLEECARLASLTMIQLALAESDNHRRVKLLTLRKLMIHFTEDTGISFMGNLEAPNLITLDIAAMGRGKLLDAVDANPGVFETCEEITLLQRTDVVESTTSALRAMQQVRTLDIGYCGPGAVESLKMFVQEGRQLSRLERVQCGGIFDEEAMELIVKGQFSDRKGIEQQEWKTKTGKPQQFYEQNFSLATWTAPNRHHMPKSPMISWTGKLTTTMQRRSSNVRESQAPCIVRKNRTNRTKLPGARGPRIVNNTNTGFLAYKIDAVEVPNETIARVFSKALKPVATQEDIYENELLRDRLHGICMKFNEVVNSVPELWTHIILEDKDASAKRAYQVDGSEGSVHEHISKSTGRELHISFNLAVLPAKQDEAARTWNALHAVSNRWISLFIRGAESCTKDSICVDALLGGRAMDRAKQLRIVDVAKRIDRPCQKKHERMRLCSGKLELIRSAILADVAFTPSTCLRYIHLATDQQNLNWYQFFSSCTNVSQMRWDRMCDIPSSPIVTLPSLQRLTLWTLRHLPPIFAPNLSRLEVLDRSIPVDAQVIKKFAVSPKLLTTLSLPNNPLTNAGLLEIFEQYPHIQRLIASNTEPRTEVYNALSKKILFQLRTNQKNRLTGIAFKRGLHGRAHEDEIVASTELEELCRPPGPRERPSSDYRCFLPMSSGTCIVISHFPYPLRQQDVAHAYSRKEIRARTGIEIPVLKVWIAEQFLFGKVPRGNMTLVILLGLEWEQANSLAKFGFAYGGRRYEVVCNKPS